MGVKLSKHAIVKLVSDYYPLIGILVGAALVSLSIAPLQNWDTGVEFQAATSILKVGMPYVSTGTIVNQPPLGFYVEAAFFWIFGASITAGTLLITLFGLGSTVLVYFVGQEIYGKPTGLVAAALFALSPWQLVLSRSFLIDAQCLFLSLCCLYVGILAIHMDSTKHALVSGVFFASALLTKYFAAFILLPLLLFYLYSKPKNPKHILSQLAAFALPSLAGSLVWYQGVLRQGLLFMFEHSDFRYFNEAGVVASPFFVGTFLWNYGLGAFLVAATVFSLLVYLAFRKRLPKVYVFDLIALASIVVVIAVNTVLGAALNLSSPYINAVKYDYFALPLFCLLAASLANKSLSLIKTQLNKALVFCVALASALLLAAVFLGDFVSAQNLSTSGYLLFRVVLTQDLGYSFTHASTSQNIVLMGAQYIGFVVVASTLLWKGRGRISDAFKALTQWMQKR